jgi:hypothetical protein
VLGENGDARAGKVPTHGQRHHEASWPAEGIQVASPVSSEAKAARLWQLTDSRGLIR